MFLPLLLAAAVEAGAAPAVIANPSWRSRPTGQDVQRVFPQRAKAERVNGAALVECKVQDDGTLTACVVLAEKPVTHRFGEAALRLMPKFQLEPKTADGSTVGGGTVKIPLSFIGPW